MTSDVGIEAVGGDAGGRRYRQLSDLGPVAQLRAGRLSPPARAARPSGWSPYGVSLAMHDPRRRSASRRGTCCTQGMAVHLPISIGHGGRS